MRFWHYMTYFKRVIVFSDIVHLKYYLMFALKKYINIAHTYKSSKIPSYY